MSSAEGLQARVVGPSGEDVPLSEDWVGVEGENIDVDMTNEFWGLPTVDRGATMAGGEQEQPQTALWKEISPEPRKLD